MVSLILSSLVLLSTFAAGYATPLVTPDTAGPPGFNMCAVYLITLMTLIIPLVRVLESMVPDAHQARLFI